MKKRLAGIILCLCICALALFGAGARVYAAERTFGQITASDVNLRRESNADSDVLATMPLNAEIEILGEDGNWYRVDYNGTIGYVRQDYVFVNTLGSRAAYVTADGVKLRGGPDPSAYIITTLHAGQGVKVKQMLGEWYFVIAGDESGYVHRSYLLMTKVSNTSSDLLKVGMEGQEVKRLQRELYSRGFLSAADVTGTYGAKTRAAVAEFQKGARLSSADGVAGAETLAALYDSTNRTTKANALAMQVKGTVELLDWFKGGSDWLYRYSKFVVIDVRTGESFNVRRFGGWYHADCEPLTAADTAIMKKIVKGTWTWNRRPIWVVFNGRVVAASMHSMPHMANPTQSNNFPGHFCIHLYHSKVHANSKECPRHQACVMEAYRKGR